MKHDESIPRVMRTDAQDALKDNLGAFWSGVFRDQDLVDSGMSSRILSAAQLYLDVMEALDLRDHTGSPVFHREHWHPLLIWRSQRNTGRGLKVGMEDTPVIGPQRCPDDDPDCYLRDVYKENEVFTVGGNAEYSKVNTYPIGGRIGGRLVSVRTCICDSISSPKHILAQDRDFSVDGGVIAIRKEQDPFDVEGYRLVDDGSDRAAVMWVCDGEFDTNNVADFLGYPMGFDVASTEAASAMLSAYWDAVVHGLAPRYLNAVLGAVFGVPTVKEPSVVRSVSDPYEIRGKSFVDVVTDKCVHVVRAGHILPGVRRGKELAPGDFLTDEIRVDHSLSADEVAAMVDSGELGSLSLPPGSVLGVGSSVVIEGIESQFQEDGGWFQLNTGDSVDSPFWKAVRGRTTVEERRALFDRMSRGSATVNPLKSIGYAVLANTVLVRAYVSLLDDPCAPLVLDALVRLVPAYASVLVVQAVSATAADGSDGIDLGRAADEVVTKVVSQESVSEAEDSMAASDGVAFTFVPVAQTEV